MYDSESYKWMLGNKQALSDILFSHILKHPLEKTNIYTEAYVVSLH